jgi:hypothetical protein
MLAERESAKYPFIKLGHNLLEALDLQLEDLASPTFTRVVERAKERVIETIVKGEVSAQLANPQMELLSYPIAAMFVSLIGEPFLNRRFALSEAVRAHNLLQDEYEEKILKIARNEFGWDIRQEPENIDGIMYNLKLGFRETILESLLGFMKLNGSW